MPALTPTPIAALSKAEAPAPSIFPADMPVSYDATGNVLSRYGDRSWNLTSMSTDGSTTQSLHFYEPRGTKASSLDRLIRDQHKALMWVHIDAGQARAWSTLLSTTLALKFWCNRAADKGVDLYTLLADPELLVEGSRELNATYLRLTPSAIKTLWRHSRQLGAPANLELQRLRDCVHIEARERPETNQTPLIPSRVYCATLAALDERLTVIEQDLDDLLEAYAQSKEATHKAPKDLTPAQLEDFRASALAEVTQCMIEMGYVTGPGQTLSAFIATLLGEYQLTLMSVAVAYTGMRKGEASILPLEGVLDDFTHLGSTHFEVKGATHKLSSGIKVPCTWVTSQQGVRAVRLAQRIARVIHHQFNQPPKAGQQALLFPSLSNPYKAISKQSFSRSLSRVREQICPVIEPSDIDELDALELARNWIRDDIVIGKRWPVAFHQLRRSLAVYAHRSGMVSLPALKAQLQHITEEMTLYYSDGFCRAVNLVFDKDHISHEWNAAKAESSYFGYVFGVVFSDDELLGQGVQRMADTFESRSRDATLRLFKENKLAYCETPLGGCVSTEVCKVDPLEPIPYDCLETNCVNLVVYQKRLDHVIKFQEVAVASLQKGEPGSMEHRLEARHLEILLKARARLKKGVH